MDTFARTLVPVRIEDEMRSSYMDYSMSVIIGRALPDVRDGLKPVHRRILYAMSEMGLVHNRKYVKCAGVVGEVLKKYHPHGDSAVYDALVRMAQPWNLRYTLVDGQGNFGSVDGDPAAAYRYTECKMRRLAEELLVDIDQNTVPFSPNFDGTAEEPEVLPARFPNLLVNGSEGIAVGMATKIPPHNLVETISACIALIDDPDIEVDGLMHHIPGPDFPTGGTIYGRRGVREAYATGRGRIVVRGRAEIEVASNGRQAIVIDEIPYQVNKARLIEQIADLVKAHKLEGVSGLRDESDRHGMRVVVELKKDAVGEVVLNHLYKHTPLQVTFGAILLAIVNNQPRILTLKEMISHYLSHRREVVTRRCRFELKKARERAHILEGFRIALDWLDEVITLIRHSPTVTEAREGLMARFGLTEIQANAILDLRLQRLTGLERQKIEEEYGQVMARIGELEDILSSEAKILALVRGELEAIRDQYKDERRTRIIDARADLTMHDLIAEEDQVVTMSHLGYIKRCRPDEWRTQRRGGTGTKGMDTREEDWVESLFVANTHTTLLVFTDKGRVFSLPVADVPEAGRAARGRPIVNLVPVPEGERVKSLVPIRDLEKGSLLFVSRQGLVKRTPLDAFKNLRTGGIRAAGVAEDDELVLVRPLGSEVEGGAHVMMFTKNGKCIRFDLVEVPEYGRDARGNRGIQLAEGDEVIDAVVAPAHEVAAEGADDEEEIEVEAEETDVEGDVTEEEPYETTLLTVTERGFGKRTPFAAYRKQGRYGKGILSIRTTRETGGVVGAVPVTVEDEVMLVTDTGRVIRISARSVRLVLGRSARGVRLMKLEAGEKLVDLARLDEQVEAPEVVVPAAESEGEE